MSLIDEILEKRAEFINKYSKEPERVFIPMKKISTLMKELDSFVAIPFCDKLLGMRLAYSKNEEIKVYSESEIYQENGEVFELIV